MLNTNCPNCGKDLWATLWLAVYDELKEGEITEGAYVPVDVECEECLAKHHVMLEIRIELLQCIFEKSQSAQLCVEPTAPAALGSSGASDTRRGGSR